MDENSVRYEHQEGTLRKKHSFDDEDEEYDPKNDGRKKNSVKINVRKKTW